jgi:predicted lipoprotein with Yx(FWY)xxD motif
VWGLAASLLLAVSLTACGAPADEEPTDGETTAGPAEPDATAGPDEDETDDGEAGAEAVTVMTADSDLGTILVDGEGMTLYLFTNDSPGVSTCEGGCLDAWPPLLGEPEAGAGANADLLGTIERSDGTTQVTYNDWPLYFWAQDSAPGDATGQGVNEVWWVVSPEGEAIEQV